MLTKVCLYSQWRRAHIKKRKSEIIFISLNYIKLNLVLWTSGTSHTLEKNYSYLLISINRSVTFSFIKKDDQRCYWIHIYFRPEIAWNTKVSSFHHFSDNINIERYKNVNWQGVDDLIGPNRAAVRVYVTREALIAPAASLYRRLTASITASIVTLARGNVCRLKMIKMMNPEQHLWSRK